MTATRTSDRLPRALLGAALLAAMAPADAAVSVNARGLGQVLLFPYYTVNNGNDTYVSVTNTTNRGKALKLRFRESRNSRPTLEFSIYLSAYDVWTGALFSLDANGPANLLTTDTSCTVPSIRTNSVLPQTASGSRYVPFRNFAYSGTSADGGDPGLARSREGHIELIEMGTLRSGTAPTQVLEEVTHTSATGNPNSGVPLNCSQVINDWDNINGAWGGTSGNRQLDIDLPTGGLYGSAQIINVANGTLHAYAAEAIEGFYGGTAAAGGLHQPPGNLKPDLADGSDGSATLMAQVELDDGGSILAAFDAGRADAVSAVLMTNTLHNEFDTETAIGAQTEWVMTFPTKSYYTDRAGAALAPFSDAFLDDGQSCEAINNQYWDREDLPTLVTTEDCPSFPGTPPACVTPTPALCGAATVMELNPTSSVGSASAIFGSIAPFRKTPKSSGLTLDRGHLRMSFARTSALPAASRTLVSRDGRTFFGLPAIGFASTNYVNGNAQPGKLANYSGAIRHRTRVGSVVIADPPN